MRGSFRLGRVFGITIQLHYTWFLIFAVITFGLALIFRDEAQPQPLWVPVVTGIFTSLLLFASVVAHELAHSVVAIRSGIPVRSITLFFLGGVAQMGREAARPKTELLVAIAGPVSSLLLAGVFGLMWFLIWGNSGQSADVVNPVLWLAWINLMLALFNLIPGFPLDGGRVLRAIMWQITGDYKRSSRVASRVGQGVACLLICVGVASFFGLMFREDLNPFSGVWLAFIGIFLHRAATAGYRQVELSEALRGFTARLVMDRDYAVVTPNVSLRELMHSNALGGYRWAVLVAEGRRLEGMVSFDNVKSVPQSRWDTTAVCEVMVPANKVVRADPEEEAVSVLERMEEYGISQMPVVGDGVVLGMLIREKLLRFIQIRAELRV